MAIYKKKKHLKLQENIKLQYKTNKYFQTVLLTYYTLSRGEDVLVTIKRFKENPNMLDDIFYEYIKYKAGEDIELSINSDNQTPAFAIQAPTIKPGQVLSAIKMTQQKRED